MIEESYTADPDGRPTAPGRPGAASELKPRLYQGMRWFKCDLQVQTPEDAAHWLDKELSLGSPRRSKGDESVIQEKARIFLRRCHELELDVVGITDHNFSNLEEPRDWFLTHLVEQNDAMAREMGRLPLCILPGFEVDIGYHVLCLFEPVTRSKHLRLVSQFLTKLGLASGERFEGGRPVTLRRNGANVPLRELLDYVQKHSHRGLVIAAHADQEDGLLTHSRNMGDYRMQDLLAVELTTPPAGRIRDILEGGNTDWRRSPRPPAWIMSSDAKSLAVDEQGRPKANSLGYRHTWIKMSRPSIEALRQAFLDPESRIRPSCSAPPDSDPNQVRHAYIRAIRIRGVGFLADQDIEFSPGLNCLIGGRGSGKSTVLEYLRGMLGKRRDLAEDRDTLERVERAWNTVDRQGSQIEVLWQNEDGQEDRIILQGGEPTVADRRIEDPETWFKLLPIRFFSQQQISQMTRVDGPRQDAGQARQLMPLLEAFRADELRELSQRETEIRRALETLLARRRELLGLGRDRKRVAQEYEEMDRQWRARSEIQGEALRHQGIQAELQYLQRLKDSLEATAGLLAAPARDLAESHSPLGSTAMHWPHADWFRGLDEKVEQAKERLARAVEETVAQFQREVTALVKNDPAYLQIRDEIASSEERFEAACREKGLSPQDVGRLQEIDRQRTLKRTELERLDAKLREGHGTDARIRARLSDLHSLWREQFRKRQEAAQEANQGAGRANGHRFLEVTVAYGGDRRSFAAVWRRLGPSDRRTRLGKCWEELEESVFQAFRQAEDSASPWQVLQGFLEHPETFTSPDLRDKLKELENHLHAREDDWEKACLTRVEDSVDLTLYRKDGTLAGCISDGSLSDGQRNTAVLALLLAHGRGPLVIDQPEDELDSNFIYRDLVPLLREAKDSRQVLLATHNANLPVNGDAELVVALEAQGGRGRIRAEGGLDRKEVTDSVLEIMEGSKEAFRRRHEKYHF